MSGPPPPTGEVIHNPQAKVKDFWTKNARGMSCTAWAGKKTTTTGCSPPPLPIKSQLSVTLETPVPMSTQMPGNFGNLAVCDTGGWGERTDDNLSELCWFLCVLIQVVKNSWLCLIPPFLFSSIQNGVGCTSLAAFNCRREIV